LVIIGDAFGVEEYAPHFIDNLTDITRSNFSLLRLIPSSVSSCLKILHLLSNYHFLWYVNPLMLDHHTNRSGNRSFNRIYSTIYAKKTLS
jgi:hypothetical protein